DVPSQCFSAPFLIEPTAGWGPTAPYLNVTPDSKAIAPKRGEKFRGASFRLIPGALPALHGCAGSGQPVAIMSVSSVKMR
ncbi:MAG: hypothetical protein VW806_12360, partial [Halieaceae bacterium]